MTFLASDCLPHRRTWPARVAGHPRAPGETCGRMRRLVLALSLGLVLGLRPALALADPAAPRPAADASRAVSLAVATPVPLPALVPASLPAPSSPSTVLPEVRAVSRLLQGGSEALRFELSQPWSGTPTGFSTHNPPRIAIDLPGVRSGMSRATTPIPQGPVRSVTVVQAPDRTRLVLTLKAPARHLTRVEGQAIVVLLDPPGPGPGAGQSASDGASAPPMTAPAGATAGIVGASPPALRDIDFRRGTGQAGRVLVELPHPQVAVDLRSQGPQLVVEFLGTALPEGLRRRLDVSDFGTPVKTVTTTAVGDRVRMVIEPRGPWETSAYQSDSQFVIELRPPRGESAGYAPGPRYTGEKITLDFQAVELRNLLQVFSDYANVNVVVADSVTGALTLRLREVPWDQALDLILDAKNLKMRRSGNILWIAPKEEVEAREKQEREEGNARLNDEPVRTQAFQLNYARARTVAEQLQAGNPSSRVLGPRGSALAEERTNQLFVTDTPARLEQVQALITRVDVPVRQVLIEARIVEAADTFGKSLGVRLGGSDQGRPPGLPGPGNNRWSVGGTYSGLAGANREMSVTLDPTNTNFVNLPAVGQAGFNASSFAISLFNAAANRFLNLELSALEADGKGKLVSSPRIVTADKTKALIEQGTEFPYQQATASGATSVAFRRATLKLEVTPNITPEGHIILDLDVSKDSRGETTAAGIAINTKHIRTQVLVENGGTVVIGGIFELTETENEARVPVLGELPGVGALFRNRQRTTNKQEMLVFITPKMITDRGAER